MKLSIVTTLYNSSVYIDDFYKRISKEAQNITDDYEIILVNDGSPDGSLQRAISLYQRDDKVKVIDLSRNFGHHKAIMTGLAHAKGAYVFLIDSDLEEEPELLGKFWKEMNTHDDVDVVYGVQRKRKGSWFERLSGNVFYRLFKKLSNINLPENVLTARLTTQRYNQALIAHTEREIFLAGLWVITGFKQVPLQVNKLSHSATTYSMRHKLGLLVNFVTSFSDAPLKFVLYLGFLISALSFVFIVLIIMNKFLFNVSLEGWSSLIVSIWFLGGLILFALGTVGLYISKIFVETKSRPYTIIKEIYEKKK